MDNRVDDHSGTERALQELFGTGSARVRLVTHVAPALRDRIQESATRNSRSASREIAHQLAKVYATEAVRASLSSGGVDAEDDSDPSSEASQSAPPELSEPYLGPIIADASDLVLVVRDPAEAGVTTGGTSGQAEPGEASSGVPSPAQGNDDLGQFRGSDQRSAKFRKLGK